MLDPQLAQQLTGLVQQMLQVLQQAGGVQPTQPPANVGDPTAVPPAGGSAQMPPNAQPAQQQAPPQGQPPQFGDGDGDEGMGDDMGDDDGDEDPDDMDADDASGGDDGTGAGGLHDRISKLEQHTGLKKSAGASMPFALRVDALEQHQLGELYEGTVYQRVEQLEAVLGLAKSAAAPEPVQSAVEPDSSDDEAPEEIRLEDLIKAAVSSALDQQSAKFETQLADLKKSLIGDDETPAAELPDITTLRKQAAATGAAQRKGIAAIPETEEALQKMASDWGMGDDLDAPASLGDLLMLQYRAGELASDGAADAYVEDD